MMKVRVNRAAFADAATWVSQVIPKNPNAPVLAGIRLTASDGTLTLAGFDYETAHTATVEADVLGDGECVVSGRTLAQIVAGMKSAEVELHQEDARLTISAGRSTYRVGLMVVDDFPNMPEFPPTLGKVDAARLVEAVGMVEHAASRDPMLPVLTTVHVSTTAGELGLATTDRFRLAHATVAAEAFAAGLSVNIPALPLVAALKGLSGEVTIAASDSLFGLLDDQRQVTTRLMDVEFPDVIRAMGAIKSKTLVEVGVEDLSAAVKRTMVLVDEKKKTTVVLSFDEGEIAVTVENDDGDGAEFVEAEHDGPALEARFNGRYLLDALTAVPTGRVQLGLTTPHAVVRITPIGDERAAFAVMTRRGLA